MKTQTFMIAIFSFAVFANPFLAQAIDRRGPQFKTDSAHLVIPAPYSVPGVGEGIAYTAVGTNLFDSYIDAFAMYATGDVEGTYFGFSDLHLISEILVLGYDRLSVNSAGINNYSSRGINTEKDDYTILKFNQLDESKLDLTLTCSDRWGELFYEKITSEAAISEILDPEGNLLTQFDKPASSTSEKVKTGLRIDYTDDYLDPREGIRLEISRSNSPPTSAAESDYVVNDKKLNLYFPVGKQSTLAFHGLYSDAEVTKVGVTDQNQIAGELGLTCAYADCSSDEQYLVDRKVVEREKGKASTLGGFNTLRSYPLDRFQGAHTRFFSTEFRWNFADKITPFDFWIWKDIATTMQVVAFYDIGTVAESESELWKESAYSVGTGFRMVAASGYVYRADFATGSEGPGTVMVFEYPW